jgi:hypothetical protein
MRWYFWSGILCLFGSLVIGGVLLLYPRSQSELVNVHLLDGTSAQVNVTVAERGWVKDANSYSVKITTQPGTSSAFLQFWGRLEMTGQDLEPQGISERVIRPGDETTFQWQARTNIRGDIPGVLWLYQSRNDTDKELLYAKEFKFTDSDFLGVPVLAARITAGSLLLLALLFIWLERRKIAKSRSKNDQNLVL